MQPCLDVAALDLRHVTNQPTHASGPTSCSSSSSAWSSSPERASDRRWCLRDLRQLGLTHCRDHSFAPFFWTRPKRSEVHVIDLSSRVSTLLGLQQPVPSSGEVGARNAGRTAWPTSLQTLSTEAAWPPLGLKEPRCACAGTWRRACDARKESLAPTKTQKPTGSFQLTW